MDFTNFLNPSGSGGVDMSATSSAATGPVSFGNSIIGAKNQFSLVKILAVGGFTLLVIKLIKKGK